ncbi:50S ribosomal protein L16 [Candidatus Sneabacter namystus]|uniref:Large ribosomal subunit protein uL16 n=1 Tax=Candidatus Sneabacter namystus TaxID=2601646 RepID=A0A5C0UJS0_9RICK|nr:50S ribosomal protein L16 [Candidatus Sneabacter namystus]QEK39773.1 50S ribosomal protein L16 [Candidatus Sneabacter namystus]
MLAPSKQKYRKMQKGRVASVSKGGTTLAFGSFGLKALQMDRITSRQIEAARIAATRYMKRKGKMWIRVFPSIPVSKKPTEVRMGKGKGSPECFVFRVSPGRILFEVDGVSKEEAMEALRLAGAKMPIKTKVTIRQGLANL